jgi:hypothetical protein
MRPSLCRTPAVLCSWLGHFPKDCEDVSRILWAGHAVRLEKPPNRKANTNNGCDNNGNQQNRNTARRHRMAPAKQGKKTEFVHEKVTVRSALEAVSRAIAQMRRSRIREITDIRTTNPYKTATHKPPSMFLLLLSEHLKPSPFAAICTQPHAACDFRRE